MSSIVNDTDGVTTFVPETGVVIVFSVTFVELAELVTFVELVELAELAELVTFVELTELTLFATLLCSIDTTGSICRRIGVVVLVSVYCVGGTNDVFVWFRTEIGVDAK